MIRVELGSGDWITGTGFCSVEEQEPVCNRNWFLFRLRSGTCFCSRTGTGFYSFISLFLKF